MFLGVLSTITPLVPEESEAITRLERLLEAKPERRWGFDRLCQLVQPTSRIAMRRILQYALEAGAMRSVFIVTDQTGAFRSEHDGIADVPEEIPNEEGQGTLAVTPDMVRVEYGPAARL